MAAKTLEELYPPRPDFSDRSSPEARAWMKAIQKAHIGTRFQCSFIMKKHRCTNVVVHVKIGGVKQYGTRCRYHGGSAQLAKLRDEVKIAKAIEKLPKVKRLGVPRVVDQGDAALGLLYQIQGNVDAFQEMVRQLVLPPGLDPDIEAAAIDGESLDDIADRALRPPQTDETLPEQWRRDSDEDSKPGALAPVMFSGAYKDVEPHMVWKMYTEERRLLMSVLRMISDLGIAERQMRLAEVHMRFILQTIAMITEDARFGMTDELKQLARKLVADNVRRFLADPTKLPEEQIRPAPAFELESARDSDGPDG